MGDFNEILDHSEKWGAATRSRGQMEDFQLALEDSQLCDLGVLKDQNTLGIMEELTRVSPRRDWEGRWPIRNCAKFFLLWTS